MLALSRVTINFRESYKNVKHEYDCLLKKARSEEYGNKIKNSDNKSKCMWQICNEITGRSNKTVDFGIKGNPGDTANEYNEYLLSIVPKLLNELRTLPCNLNNINSNNKSMFLRPMSTVEICEFSKKIKNKQSSGLDDVPSSIVKISIPIIKDVLCYMINNSFKQGIFPDRTGPEASKN